MVSSRRNLAGMQCDNFHIEMCCTIVVRDGSTKFRGSGTAADGRIKKILAEDLDGTKYLT